MSNESVEAKSEHSQNTTITDFCLLPSFQSQCYTREVLIISKNFDAAASCLAFFSRTRQQGSKMVLFSLLFCRCRFEGWAGRTVHIRSDGGFTSQSTCKVKQTVPPRLNNINLTAAANKHSADDVNTPFPTPLIVMDPPHSQDLIGAMKDPSRSRRLFYLFIQRRGLK